MLVPEELPMPTVGPRIVVGGEVGAVLRGGVIVEPELDEWVRVGVFEIRLAKGIEGGDGGSLRVGNEPVDRFLPVDVGLVRVARGAMPGCSGTAQSAPLRRTSQAANRAQTKKTMNIAMADSTRPLTMWLRT